MINMSRMQHAVAVILWAAFDLSCGRAGRMLFRVYSQVFGFGHVPERNGWHWGHVLRLFEAVRHVEVIRFNHLLSQMGLVDSELLDILALVKPLPLLHCHAQALVEAGWLQLTFSFFGCQPLSILIIEEVCILEIEVIHPKGQSRVVWNYIWPWSVRFTPLGALMQLICS